MQVPAGKPHGRHGPPQDPRRQVDALPTAPDQDTTSSATCGPSATAATLNLAATAAQAARIWQTLDPAFAARCLDGRGDRLGRRAGEPDTSTPNATARAAAPTTTTTLGDEFYWAAAELYITTGKPTYKAELEQSRFQRRSDAAAMTAGNSAGTTSRRCEDEPAGRRPNALGDAAIAEQRRQLIAAADRLLGFIDRARLPRADGVGQRRTSGARTAACIDAAVVLGIAYNLTHDAQVRERRHRLHGLPARAQPAGVQLRLRLRHARAAQPAPPRLGAPEGREAARGAARVACRAAPTRRSRIPTSASSA